MTKQENNPETIREYLSSLDSRLQTLQSPILSFIGANQEQVLSNLNAIKEKGLIENEKQDRVLNVLEEFLEELQIIKKTLIQDWEINFLFLKFFKLYS